MHLMNQLVWGVDLVEEQMLASAGIPSRPYISKRPNHFVAEYSVNAKHTGIIKNLDFLEVSAPSPLLAYMSSPHLPPIRHARLTLHPSA